MSSSSNKVQRTCENLTPGPSLTSCRSLGAQRSLAPEHGESTQTADYLWIWCSSLTLSFSTPRGGAYFVFARANSHPPKKNFLHGRGAKIFFPIRKSHPCHPSRPRNRTPSEGVRPSFLTPQPLFLTPQPPPSATGLADVGLHARHRAAWMPPVLGISDSTLPNARGKLPLKWRRPHPPSLTLVGSSPKFRAVARS